MSHRNTPSHEPEGIELHPGVRLQPMGEQELRDLAGCIDPKAAKGISSATLAEALRNIDGEADWRLRHMQAQCRAVLALLPGDRYDRDALYRHPAFQGRPTGTPEGEALRDLMHAIATVRELVSNGIAGFCEQLGEYISMELEDAGVLSSSVEQYRRQMERHHKRDGGTA